MTDFAKRIGNIVKSALQRRKNDVEEIETFIFDTFAESFQEENCDAFNEASCEKSQEESDETIPVPLEKTHYFIRIEKLLFDEPLFLEVCKKHGLPCRKIARTDGDHFCVYLPSSILESSSESSVNTGKTSVNTPASKKRPKSDWFAVNIEDLPDPKLSIIGKVPEDYVDKKQRHSYQEISFATNDGINVQYAEFSQRIVDHIQGKKYKIPKRYTYNDIKCSVVTDVVTAQITNLHKLECAFHEILDDLMDEE